MKESDCHYKENGIGPSAGALQARAVLLKTWMILIVGGVIALCAGSVVILTSLT